MFINGISHPVIGGLYNSAVQGNAIGLALEEHPLIAPDSGDAFEAGDIYSLRVGLAATGVITATKFPDSLID